MTIMSERDFAVWKKANGATNKSVAKLIGVPIDTVKSWSCGRRRIPSMAVKLLQTYKRDR